MLTTRDYSKLGRTTWHVQVFGDDGIDPWAKTLATAELSTLAVAKRWTRAAVTHWRAHGPDGLWVWAQLVAGTYVDASFSDPDDGLVRHASWEPSDSDRYSTWLTDSGRLRFQEA
jgi:hypothetical protein